MQFYVYLNGVQRGPLSEERVHALLEEGLLLGSDLAVEHPGDEWRALSTFRRFTPEASRTDGSLDVLFAPSLVPAIQPIMPKRTEVEADGESPIARPLSRDTLGPYARATLAPTETPIYRTSLHWFVFVRFALLALLAFLFLALPLAIGVQALTGSQIGWFALPLPALILLRPTFAFASSELVITDQRVLIKTGVVTRETLEMFIPRIESIGVYQSVLGRMFDFGTVTIKGLGGSEEAFAAIAHPLEFRNTVQQLQTAKPDSGA